MIKLIIIFLIGAFLANNWGHLKTNHPTLCEFAGGIAPFLFIYAAWWFFGNIALLVVQGHL